MVLSQQFHGETEENHLKPQDSWAPGRYLNPGPLEYEAEVTHIRRGRPVVKSWPGDRLF
jgi:hypothetical protein